MYTRVRALSVSVGGLKSWRSNERHTWSDWAGAGSKLISIDGIRPSGCRELLWHLSSLWARLCKYITTYISDWTNAVSFMTKCRNLHCFFVWESFVLFWWDNWVTLWVRRGLSHGTPNRKCENKLYQVKKPQIRWFTKCAVDSELLSARTYN